MVDLYPKKKRISAILKANGVQCKKEFADATHVPPKEAWALANSLVNAIELLTEYCVNNGFKQYKDEIEALIQAVVDISPIGGTVDKGTLSRTQKQCAKRLDKPVKAGVLKKNADMYKLSSEYTLNLSKSLIDCIEATIADGNAIVYEISGISREDYEREFTAYTGGKPLMPYDKWQEDCQAIVGQASEYLFSINEALQGAIDRSSQKAADDAAAIVISVSRWREELVRSYLLLDKSMLKHLIPAVERAKSWGERKVGVVNIGYGEQVPRASFGKNYVWGDALAAYVSANHV